MANQRDRVFSHSVEFRAVGYYRVSTEKQVERDLSVPDQRRQTEEFCKAKGWRLVGEYVEAGLTATDDNRPEFQRMMEKASDADRTFDVIIVHSFSRFMRDTFLFEFYYRKLEKAKIRLVSISQPLGDEPGDKMLRHIITLFDQYTSGEISKHVRRGMKENARQGFWNGSPPPLGYCLIEAERRGEKIKRRLAVDEVEAELVRLIFKLYRLGIGTKGPMGIKAIASYLNSEGYRTRRGGYFGTSLVARILRDRTYIGEYVYNKKNYKMNEMNPAEDRIIIPVPVIIEGREFDEVQALLTSRNPRVTPPRIVTGPILLTGLAFCAKCGGGMTMSTGTSHTNKVYNYYSCVSSNKMGKLACAGRRISMPTLDRIVVEHLADRLFTPERIGEIIEEVHNRTQKKASESDKRAADLRKGLLDVETRLGRLYSSIEQGIVELDDLLREKIATLQAERRQVDAALDRVREASVVSVPVTEDMIESFARVMRLGISEGPIELRKAYLRSMVERIEISDDAIVIVGAKVDIERSIKASDLPLPKVRNFIPKWHALGESNPSLQNENLSS